MSLITREQPSTGCVHTPATTAVTCSGYFEVKAKSVPRFNNCIISLHCKLLYWAGID